MSSNNTNCFAHREQQRTNRQGQDKNNKQTNNKDAHRGSPVEDSEARITIQESLMTLARVALLDDGHSRAQQGPHLPHHLSLLRREGITGLPEELAQQSGQRVVQLQGSCGVEGEVAEQVRTRIVVVAGHTSQHVARRGVGQRVRGFCCCLDAGNTTGDIVVIVACSGGGGVVLERLMAAV